MSAFFQINTKNLSRKISSNFPLCATLFSVVAIIPAIGFATESKDVELYIKIHMSLDQSYDGQNQALSVSNNSSRFGFRGNHKIDNKNIFHWRMENKVYIDESGGRLGNPAYAGFKTKYGRLFIGFIDTPYKTFVSKFNVMDDSIADVRSIFGYSSQGADVTDNLNVRARNAIFYDFVYQQFKFAALYSAEKASTGTATNLDDNSNDGYSASLEFKNSQLKFGAAAESWNSGQELRGVRIGGRYRVNKYDLGVVWERIDSPLDAKFDRDALSLDIGIQALSNNRIKLQYIVADSNKVESASGAQMLTLSTYHNLDKKNILYLIATKLDNGKNAKYRLGTSGHGDIVVPEFGSNTWSVSLGVIYLVSKFF